MEPTSLTLLDRLQQQRRPEDWTRFVDLYEPFIRMDAKLAADSDDVCQEVMRKIVSHLPRFERNREGSLRCWLKTITVNEVSAYWRRKLRKGNVSAPANDLMIESLADPNNALSELWDREHGAHILRRLQELGSDRFASSHRARGEN